MYYRQQNTRIRVPSNYGGSAFSEIKEEQQNEKEPEVIASTLPDPPPKEEPAVAEASLKMQNKGIGSILGGKIGGEELLLLALIWLLADTDNGNEVVWLLLLLLFVK